MHPRLTQSPPPTPVAGIRDASSSPTDLYGAGDNHRAGGETTNPRQSPRRSTDGTSRRWGPRYPPDDDPEVAGAEATTLERRPPAALELALTEAHRTPRRRSRCAILAAVRCPTLRQVHRSPCLLQECDACLSWSPVNAAVRTVFDQGAGAWVAVVDTSHVGSANAPCQA